MKIENIIHMYEWISDNGWCWMHDGLFLNTSKKSFYLYYNKRKHEDIGLRFNYENRRY